MFKSSDGANPKDILLLMTNIYWVSVHLISEKEKKDSKKFHLTNNDRSQPEYAFKND